MSETPTTDFTHVHPGWQRAVSVWLLICLVMIGCMVSLGGYTRLSGSGLSITEWKPIHGTIPPIGVAEWQEEFDKYRTIPQYQQVNRGMSLDEFKAIYWPEFWHRNVGRMIGLTFALPLFFFLLRGAFARRFAGRLGLILLLGGGQGLIGWIMVASGLSERLYVHHLKLSLHFGMAMLLASAVFWSWLDAVSKPTSGKDGSRMGAYLFAGITLLIFLQLCMGAMVAGLHAGLIYNSFPLMNGDWIAPDVLTYSGSWFDHVPMMQFIHRWLAKLIVVLVVIWWWAYRQNLRDALLFRPLIFLGFVLACQFILGVLTLINAVPLGYAMLHQWGGFMLLLSALYLLHCLKLRIGRNI